MSKKKQITILSLHLNFGGIEKAITSLANSLIDDYEIEIISVYKLNDKPVFDLNKNVKVKYLLQNNSPNKEEFKKALKAFNIIKILAEGKRALKTLHLRKKETIKSIKDLESDVIISTRDLFNKWLSKYGNKDKLLIGWEHNHHNGDYKYASKVIKSTKGLNYLVLVSKNLYNFYNEKLIEKKYKCKAVYIPNALDEIPKNLAHLKNKKLISVGRLSPEKGYLDLLSIFAMVNKKRPDWSLEIIGDGNQKDLLINKTKEKNLEKKINFHGFRKKDYINSFLSESSIYIMTSLTESFGIVLLEAMSHGLPCVAFTSAEGANELIINNKTGYLVKDRNKKEMAGKIIELIDDFDKRTQTGSAGREAVLKYTPENSKKTWLKLLNK